MIKNVMKRQVSFIQLSNFFHLAEFQNGFFCFIFEKMSSSVPMLLVMLFAHVGKLSNSRSQVFFKTSLLKTFTTVNFTFTKIFKQLKYQREASSLKLNNFGFKFFQVRFFQKQLPGGGLFKMCGLQIY